MNPPALAGAADAVAAAATFVFDVLAKLGDEFCAVWSQVGAATFQTSDLARLQRDVWDAIDANPAFEGAGYVLTESTATDQDRHLEWWHRSPDGTHDKVRFNLDPDAPDGYDYYSMEWFRAALDSSQRAVSGPLIDLPCADVYILTFATPMIADGRLLGVAGADVAVSRMERSFLAPLRELDGPAVLVNRERRVIASNDARYTTGEKLPTTPGTDTTWSHVTPVTPDIGWLLAADLT